MHFFLEDITNQILDMIMFIYLIFLYKRQQKWFMEIAYSYKTVNYISFLCMLQLLLDRKMMIFSNVVVYYYLYLRMNMWFQKVVTPFYNAGILIFRTM